MTTHTITDFGSLHPTVYFCWNAPLFPKLNCVSKIPSRMGQLAIASFALSYFVGMLYIMYANTLLRQCGPLGKMPAYL